jgi:hypothetical protein
LVQVELDALDPNDLRALYTEAVNQYFDMDTHYAILEEESKEEAVLYELTQEISGVEVRLEEEE